MRTYNTHRFAYREAFISGGHTGEGVFVAKIFQKTIIPNSKATFSPGVKRTAKLIFNSRLKIRAAAINWLIQRVNGAGSLPGLLQKLFKGYAAKFRCPKGFMTDLVKTIEPRLNFRNFYKTIASGYRMVRVSGYGVILSGVWAKRVVYPFCRSRPFSENHRMQCLRN